VRDFGGFLLVSELVRGRSDDLTARHVGLVGAIESLEVLSPAELLCDARPRRQFLPSERDSLLVTHHGPTPGAAINLAEHGLGDLLVVRIVDLATRFVFDGFTIYDDCLGAEALSPGVC
jgi:hypothetical protein